MKLLTNPAIWLVLFFVLRVENYPNSIIHQDYNWRTAYTGMVSRNMLEVGPNPFFPKVDNSENSNGIAACEFPVFNALQFGAFKLFGYAKWYGRFINLVVSTIALWFFFQISRRILKDDYLALAAMVFLATSIWYSFSRRNMPDTFALSLCIISVEFGYRYLEKGKWLNLSLFFLFCTAGLLSKMPAACVLPLLIPPMFLNKNIDFLHKKLLFSASTLAVFIMCLWYFWWVPYLEEIGAKLTWPETFASGWQQVFYQFREKTIWQFKVIMFQGEFVFWLSCIGLFYALIKKQTQLLLPVLAWLVVSMVFILKAGFIFSTHDYYTVPLVPMMAILAAYAFSILKAAIRNYLMIPVLLGVCFFSIKRQTIWYNTVPPYDMSLNRLEALVDSVVPKNAKVVANDIGFSPVIMFWSHRKGVLLDNNQIKLPGYLSGKADQGATYAIVSKFNLKDSLPFEVALDDIDFRIYKLHKTAETKLE